MEIVLLPDADDDLNFWVKSGNKAILKKFPSLFDLFRKLRFKELVNQKVWNIIFQVFGYEE